MPDIFLLKSIFGDFMFVAINMKKIKKVSFFLVAAAVVIAAGKGVFNKKSILTMADGNTKGYLAIIIDDFGYNGEGTEEMLSLDIPFTAAVMPFSSNTDEDIAKIKEAGKDYIIHMPMESLTGKREWVGEKGVFVDMTDEAIKSAVRDAFDKVDGASGMNNHMGSAVMEDERCLSAVIDEVAARGGVFVDSVTTSKSLGEKICAEKGVDIFKRDVFLDSTDDSEVVCGNIEKAGKIAIENGFAIAIGHVGPEGGLVTANAIKSMYPKLMGQGVEFVTISRLSELVSEKSDY